MKIYSRADKNVAYIEGVSEAFTGALIASESGDLISITHAGLNRFLVSGMPFGQITDANGNTFSSSQNCINYLNSIFVVQFNAALTFYFTQATNPWIINHNLGYFPSVKVYSIGGAEVDCDIQNVSVNQVQVNFNNPFAGFARIS